MISLSARAVNSSHDQQRPQPQTPFDPDEAVAHLKAADPKLAALIDRAGPFTLRLDPAPSPFESLLESILYQQLHGKAAATIHRRVREYFGGDPTPQLLLDTPDEPLRAAGVSGNKIKALRDLAAALSTAPSPPTPPSAKCPTPTSSSASLKSAASAPGPWKCSSSSAWAARTFSRSPTTASAKAYALTFQRLPKTRPLAAEDLPKPDVLSNAESAGRPSAPSPVGTCGAPAILPNQAPSLPQPSGRSSLQ
jgi:DNA-3-methyladenine glycosylase II